MIFKFTLNGTEESLDIDPSMPLLWALRDIMGLTGTKYGCGIAACGVCTVLVDGAAVRSCVTSLASVQDKRVTTIEGLAGEHPLQHAWIDEQVPQCGFCQPGQIMQAAALLASNSNPTREQIRDSMNGVLCRCGTYLRIESAIRRAAEEMRNQELRRDQS